MLPFKYYTIDISCICKKIYFMASNQRIIYACRKYRFLRWTIQYVIIIDFRHANTRVNFHCFISLGSYRIIDYLYNLLYSVPNNLLINSFFYFTEIFITVFMTVFFFCILYIFKCCTSNYFWLLKIIFISFNWNTYIKYFNTCHSFIEFCDISWRPNDSSIFVNFSANRGQNAVVHI